MQSAKQVRDGRHTRAKQPTPLDAGTQTAGPGWTPAGQGHTGKWTSGERQVRGCPQDEGYREGPGLGLSTRLPTC